MVVFVVGNGSMMLRAQIWEMLSKLELLKSR